MKGKYIILSMLLLTAAFPVLGQNASPVMPDMVLVEGGTFMMGNNSGFTDEIPAHKVTLNSFYIGRFEVTWSEFRRFIDATGYKTDAEEPDTLHVKHGLPPRGINNGTWKTYMNGKPVPASDSSKPVGNISWNDAVAYLAWLSKVTGKDFRLPTEAEWEFAARGGNKSKGYKYAGSNNLDEVAWYADNAGQKVHTGGTKMPNELGIFDLAGNVREWCSDWFNEYYYKVSPEENPQGSDRGSRKILRGGSWTSGAERMRLTYRNYDIPYNSALDFGFRPAISGPPAPKPEPKPEPTPEPKNEMMKELDSKGVINIYGIYFDTGKWKVKPEGYPIIDQLVGYMKDNQKIRIMIEGHTDNVGSPASNKTLSQKRAESIKDEMVKRGIDPGRIETLGLGASQPIADNSTADGRTQNRRVTVKKL